MGQETGDLIPDKRIFSKEGTEKSIPDIKPIGTKDGLPIISKDGMAALMFIKAKENEGQTVSVDFRGYVDMEKPEGLVYREVLSANRILGIKDDAYTGVDIHIWGVRKPGDLESGFSLRSPDDRKAYVASIRVSGDLMTKKQLETTTVGNKNAYYKVLALVTNPQTDSLAWDKMKQIHNAVTEFIDSGKDLDQLEDFILRLDSTLNRPKKAYRLD